MDTNYGLLEFTKNNLFCYIAYQTNTFLANIKRKPQITYLCNYLNDLKDIDEKIYFIYENEYIDQHYLEDYAAYYVRCFNNYKKNTTRVHFFKTAKNYEDCNEDLKKALNGDKNTFINNSNYLGYIVIRPIQETFLAKVCLKPYYEKKERNKKFVLTKKCKVSLFGIELIVNTIAFQEQDRVVSACATTSIWSFFNAHPKKNLMDIPSPNLITKSAYSEDHGFDREFPNTGLSIGMICNSLRKYDLSPEYFQFFDHNDKSEVITQKFNLFKEYIHAYCSSGLPLILAVSIKDAETNKFKGLHAVTIVGFSMNNTSTISNNLISENLEKIYVHDDRLGPFLRMNLKKIHLKLI